jgi:nitrate reductase NapE component
MTLLLILVLWPLVAVPLAVGMGHAMAEED